MNLWLRLIYEKLTWRFRTRLHWSDVGRRTFRVWPSDLDVFKHMNNGVFLTLMDISRYDLALRSGTWKKWKKLGWYPVVVAETITFRKSLLPWQAFDMESRVVGWDDQAFYFEQRFVVAGEIYTRAVVRIRFLKRPKGILSPREVSEGTGGWQGPEPQLPEFIKHWAAETGLPKGKEPAPSHWD
ncbi:acyl-CoA thioesterase [Candidatus Rhodoluna planktonica]|uniref:4-hydroxybenzoyl-CoA thioesterase n=1 Tax=Candidatus Rhodoluna planktonica TaxID=535712 RepID=A0A1D9E0N2_9MICO|nr:thioesterase family protein [Candidatus Rhodoluna planktonica]AOY56615.1 4-hydroxybenzoyl-CoA thioesterase [Candidatus Rhodoluna planktonica]